MKTCYLDSNVVLSFIDSSAQYHNQSKQIIYKLVAEGWEINVSALTLDECFHNFLRFSKKLRTEAIKELKARYKKLIKLPNINLVAASIQLRKHAKIFNLMDKYTFRSRDAYHLFTMKENRIEYMATFDHDFDKVFEKDTVKKFE